MTNKEWNEIKESLSIGMIVQGIVKKHEVFGIFIDIGYKYDAFVDRINISDKSSIQMDEYPKIGEKIKGKILDFRESKTSSWKEIVLDIRPSKID